MLRRVLFFVACCALAGCMQNASSPDAPRGVVFFTADSAALDDAALGAIRESAALARANPSTIVHVRGFAAPDTGTAAFNRTLAQARAQAVADNLAAAGVPANRIRIESRGAVPFEMMPTESRRVEIVIGG